MKVGLFFCRARPGVQKSTSERDPSGRGCCDMPWRTSRLLSRSTGSSNARVASTHVLGDLPALLGEAVVAEARNSSWR
jgi:hypothetical protein